MTASRRNPWLSVGMELWMAGVEASTVIGLRTLKIAAGGADGDREARLMVAEKVAAGLDIQAKALSGALGGSPPAAASRVITHYRRKIRANRRRLQRRG